MRIRVKILRVVTILCVVLATAPSYCETKGKSESTVSVVIPDTGETETIELKRHQTAQVKVYLSSLGDMLDSYMVSLFDTDNNKLVDNLISDESGEVIFRKLPVGNYAVSVNRKVATEEQEKGTVKISDLMLRAFP